MLLLEGDISLYLTPYLKIDDTVYNASNLMTFSCVWEDVFTASQDVGRLTHTEWSWYDRLWSLPLCLCLLLFPQWTSAYVDPHPPWKSRTKIHEMRCQILLSLWHGGGGGGRKKKCDSGRTKKKKKKKSRSGPNCWPLWGVCVTRVHHWWTY